MRSYENAMRNLAYKILNYLAMYVCVKRKNVGTYIQIT